MHAMTLANLQSAFGGESQAHMRYLIYADKAEKEGFANVARLFRAIGYAEQVHANNHFLQMRDNWGDAQVVSAAGFGLGPTAENLGVAIAGEEFEVDEMYPAYKATAELQTEKGPLRSFDWAWQAEKTHAEMFNTARVAVQGGSDLSLGVVNVCGNCGHTLEGDAPDRCPICNAKRELYCAFP